MDSSSSSMQLLTQSSTFHGPSHPRRNNKRQPVHTLQSDKLSLTDAAKMEMAALHTKTPVSVLQELLSRRGITPKYELVQIEGAIHEPIFRYRVYLNSDFVATGTGRSKKEAKHAAAKNLLDLLAGKQSQEQANATNGTAAVAATAASAAAAVATAASTPNNDNITSQIVSPFDDKVMGNPIGWLQEMCMSRRWPPPSYEMEHEEGLPHERQFTIACQVLKFREIGMGKSKKLAKRMAAHKMWQALQDVPIEGNSLPQGFDYDEELTSRMNNNPQGRFASLKDSTIPALVTPHSQKVSAFHKNLCQATGEKLKELQTTSLSVTDFDYVQFLQELALEQQFEVTFVDVEEKTLKGESQCLLQLSTLPVAVCYGCGPSSKDAQARAAQSALEYLKLMTKK